MHLIQDCKQYTGYWHEKKGTLLAKVVRLPPLVTLKVAVIEEDPY